MPIRDVLLVGLVVASLPLCFWRPYYGVLVWTWISFMSPHRLSWGFAYDLPLAQMVALPMLAGFLFTKERRSIPLFAESIFLGGFWILTFVTTLYALYPGEAWADFEQFSKVLLVTFVTISLVQDRSKLRYVLLVAGACIGFYGLKGGFWSLATGGAGGMVLGPTGSFIEDNNSLSLALNMILPIVYYLAREEQRLWVRKLLYATFFLTVVAVIFTYSRAGFLGLLVVLSMIVARSRWKSYALALAFVAVIGLVSFVPERWFNRMNTISEYEQDRSAMSRIYAWKLGWQLALDSPLVGGGFRVFGHDEIWAKYAPDYYFGIGKDATNRTPNAHSIYFLTLGEHGFIGFFLFVGLILSTLVSLRRTRRYGRSLRDGTWLVNYSFMVETSIVAFLVTGAFQNLAYFDLFYFLIGTTIVLRRLAATAAAEPEQLAIAPAVSSKVAGSIATVPAGFPVGSRLR
jgi:putative inorganic carbon (HCO3(-)) transporter